MSLRVALIVPPAPFLSIPNASPHLGVLYLASFLQKVCSSVEVDIIDLCAERKICGIDSAYHYYCFSASTPQYPYANEIMEQLRNQGTSGRFVIGGPHVTFCYKEALEDGFDLVVIGEGEIALSKIVSERLRNGVIQGTPISDLSSIPHPAYNKINLDSYNYSFHSKRIAQIITTRGCQYSCNFCLIPNIHGKSVLSG